MIKKIVLSFVMVSGFAGAFDNNDPNEILRQVKNLDDAPKGLTAEDYQDMYKSAADTVKKFVTGESSLPEVVPSPVINVIVDQIQTETPAQALETVAQINQATEHIVLSGVLSEANQALETVSTEQVAETLYQIAADASVQGVSQEVVETLEQTATQVGGSVDTTQAQKILKQTAEDALETSKELFKGTAQESPERFAAVREVVSNAWNSRSLQFACDMFNPCAHGRAWKAMWQAGYKDALPTLWAKHKAVIAGTAVITTAAATAAYYAHKKGWFTKAKAWAAGLQKQYFVTAALV